MKVIEGKNEKSLELERIILDNSNKNILLIDTVKVKALYVYKNVKGVLLDNNENLTNNYFGKQQLIDSLILWVEKNKIDLVIFEVNENIDNLNKYLELEKLLNRECIITIQNNELDIIKIYNIK